jgi:centromeric protein E
VPYPQLNAIKKEIVDTDALIERYRKEIEDLKRRLAEREAVIEFGEGGGKVASIRGRRLSAREVGPLYNEKRKKKNLNVCASKIATGRIQSDERLEWQDSTIDKANIDQPNCGRKQRRRVKKRQPCQGGL